MDADLKKIKKLVSFMQKEGVISVKLAGIEINLAQQALSKPSLPAESNSKDKDKPSSYSHLDALFWSSDTIPDEQERQ